LLISNVRAGLSEYFIFFFCVVGIFVIRARKRAASEPEIYRTWTWNPVIFTIVSGLLVLRGIIANVLQGAAILTVLTVGWVFYWMYFRNTSGIGL
jgi:L-type amino acid transporter 6